MPKVSIIIPNYCHSTFLEQRIESVLSQSFQDFEIIILDDCSPDGGASKLVIEKYRQNSHVSNIVYNNRNSGSTFKQWEKGLQLATGEYIWIAESDDFCDDDMLECLVSQTKVNKNVSIVYCDSQNVDECGNSLEPIFHRSKERVEVMDGRVFIKNRMAFGNAIWNASSAIFKKEYASTINPQYMSYVSAGDRLFWIELAEKGDIVHVYSAKNYFRQHTNKVTPTKKKQGVTSKEDYNIVRYLERKNLIDFITSLYVRQSYMKDILQMDLDSENTRKELLKLWQRYNLFTIRRTELFLKIYHKLF